MSKLAVISGKECVKILQNHGFEFRRQKGSHIILQQTSSGKILTVPNHKTIDRGTLKSIIKQSGLDLRFFVN